MKHTLEQMSAVAEQISRKQHKGTKEGASQRHAADSSHKLPRNMPPSNTPGAFGTQPHEQIPGLDKKAKSAETSGLDLLQSSYSEKRSSKYGGSTGNAGYYKSSSTGTAKEQLGSTTKILPIPGTLQASSTNKTKIPLIPDVSKINSASTSKVPVIPGTPKYSSSGISIPGVPKPSSASTTKVAGIPSIQGASKASSGTKVEGIPVLGISPKSSSASTSKVAASLRSLLDEKSQPKRKAATEVSYFSGVSKSSVGQKKDDNENPVAKRMKQLHRGWVLH